MTNLSELKGRLALVTGAGDGIGEMLAKGFAGLGMRVAVLDIRKEAAERVASEIGNGAFALAADVSEPDQLQLAADDLKAKGETLSLLWLNAGAGVGSPIVTGKRNAVEWGFNVNVLGIAWSAQAFAPLLIGTDGPKLLGVTASTAALRTPNAPFSLYATTKHGTFAVAEAIAEELKDEGVETTILCPGLLNTDIWDGARARPDKYGGVRRMDPAISGQWKEAKSPDLMWPHIEATLAKGGGYLTCATDDGDTKRAFTERFEAIRNGIVDV